MDSDEVYEPLIGGPSPVDWSRIFGGSAATSAPRACWLASVLRVSAAHALTDVDGVADREEGRDWGAR